MSLAQRLQAFGPAPERRRPGPGPGSLREVVIALGVVVPLVLAVFVTTPVTDNHAGYDSDGRSYAAMAGDHSVGPEFARQAPWCWRVLTPFLASLLPWTTLTDFRVLAFVSNAATLVLFFMLLRAVGFAPVFSWIGTLLYAGIFWALKFSFYSPAYVDYQTQFFLVLILLLARRQKWLALVPVLALAALQKEALAAFSLFVVAEQFRAPDGPRGAARWGLVLADLAAPLLALVAVHALVDAAPGYSPPNIIGEEISRLLDPAFWLVFLQSIFSGLGVIPALLLLDLRGSWRFLRAEWSWGVYALIGLGLLLGGTDKARLFLYLLPLAVILVMRAVAARATAQGTLAVGLWAVVVLLLHAFIGCYLTGTGTFLDYLDRLVPENSPGGFLPYLAGNLALNAAALGWTVWQLKPAAAFRSRRA